MIKAKELNNKGGKTVKKILFGLLALILVAGLTLSCAPEAAPTESPADFYKGKTIHFVVSATAGGGDDTVGRLFAPYIEQATGVTMKVDNKGAGGGLEGMNLVYAADPDGLTICVKDFAGMVGRYFMGAPGVEFDLTKYSWIGHYAKGPSQLVAGMNQPDTLEEWQRMKAVKMGAVSQTGLAGVTCAIAVDIMGLDAKIISGFKGTSPVFLAIERGEVAGLVNPLLSNIKYIEKGVVKPIFNFASERHPSMPDVPTVYEFVPLTEKQKNLVDVICDLSYAGKVIFGPPGMPKDRLEYLRSAFDKVFTENREFQEALAQRYPSTEYDTGEEVTKVLERAERLMEPMMEEVRYLVLEKYVP